MPLAIDPVPEGKVVKNQLHLDIFRTEPGPAARIAEDERLVSLGATRSRYLGPTSAAEAGSPDEPHWILHDLEANEFCCLVWEEGGERKEEGRPSLSSPLLPPSSFLPS